MATILVWCWFISHLRKVWKNIFKIIPTCLTFDLSFLLSFRICNPLVTKNLSRPKTWERTFKNKLQICKERCEEGLSFFVAFYKNGPTPASFIVYFRSFQTNIITIFTTNICEKMSIQYTVLGFEPMTFGMWVSSHNH